MRTNHTDLPAPSKSHATCPWCGGRFTTIVNLLDHVDHRHLTAARAA